MAVHIVTTVGTYSDHCAVHIVTIVGTYSDHCAVNIVTTVGTYSDHCAVHIVTSVGTYSYHCTVHIVTTLRQLPLYGAYSDHWALRCNCNKEHVGTHLLLLHSCFLLNDLL